MVKNDMTGTINKTAIKNFAVYSRNKLIQDIKNKAALIGIMESGIQDPLSTSTGNIQLFHIGMQEPYRIEGKAIEQRNALVQELKNREKGSTYETAYETLIEEVAYTWFNRIIAIRFMEVNNYMPDRIRVLSSGVAGINEPELITHVFETSFEFSEEEKNRIIEFKTDGSNLAMDELFQFLFIKQCNALNVNLPELFEKTNDYSELLLTVSYNDVEGVVYKLIHEVSEFDFDVNSEDGHGQIEIVGWLYQYYNEEPKAIVDKAVKAKRKVDKFQLPAKTQLFTPDWIVKFMVENSLGRLWIEKLRANGDERSEEKIASQFGWGYYLPEAQNDDDVQEYLVKLREERRNLSVEDITFLDPAMGSFHIGIYAFEVFMQLYDSEGYTTREAAKLIIEKNLHGLEIDKRATQLSYFACMMQARKYDRKILDGSLNPHVYEIIECNDIDLGHLDYMGNNVLKEEEWEKQKEQIISLIDTFNDAKEYGSLTELKSEYSFEQLKDFVLSIRYDDQISLFNTLGLEETQKNLINLINVARLLSKKYDVLVTNPPYMGSSALNNKLVEFGKKYYPDSKSDLFAMFIEWGNKRVKYNGCNAMVTMQSWMFLSSYKDMRKKIIEKFTISNLMHMENMVMGIAFGTVATLFWNRSNNGFIGTYNYVKSKHIKDNKPLIFPDKNFRFTQLNQQNLEKIPGSPIAYWAPKALLSDFEKGISMDKLIYPRQGLATANNDRFLRYWFEVDINKIKFNSTSLEDAVASGKKWFPYNKGGARRQWYGNYDYVVNWENDGEEIRNFKDENGKQRSVIRNPRFYFKEAITWPLITSGGFSIRYRELGSIHDVSGMSAFGDDRNQLLYLLGLLGTKVANYIFKILNPTINLQVGDFNNFPVINTENSEIIKLVAENIEIAKKEWNSYEEAWEFNQHPFLIYKNESQRLSDIFETWNEICNDQIRQTSINEEKLNDIFINLYQLNGEISSKVEDKDITLRKADYKNNIKSFISYGLGCIFGRYSIDNEGITYAGGDLNSVKSTNLYLNRNNVLLITDDQYLSNDILIQFEDFVRDCYGEEMLEENLGFIARSLGNKGMSSREAIRDYFVNDFYKDHLKTYQKRPIYWLYDSGKQNGFKALIYMHRYDEDTTGKVRVDYLHQAQKAYERVAANLQDDIANSKDAKEIAQLQKRIEKITKQLKECKDYDERLGHIALERISIDLDDGVKVNYQKIQTDSKGKFYQILAEI